MKKRYFLIPLLVFSLLIMIQACATTKPDYTKATVHGPEQDCNLCHKSHKMKGSILLKKPVSELCSECHKGEKMESGHPVDIIPSMKVGTLPLSEGRMTCATCHDPHKDKYGMMLRIDSRKLCITCHNK